jgi:solute carrier family 35, member E3
MPDWTGVEMPKWGLILVVSKKLSGTGSMDWSTQSGMMAAVLNISRFFLVAGVGPVSSIVVGHLKICSIVALGCLTTGRGASGRGLFSVFMALTGIIMYVVDTRH